MAPKKQKGAVFTGLDVMIDTETLDTKATAVILSIGACRFNDLDIDNNGFYRAITLESCMDEHRTISPATLLWWMKQEQAAQAAAFHDPTAVPLSQALDEFRDWMGPRWEATRVWSNGADFDIPLITHAYGSQPTPWIFWNTRCFRTIKNMAGAKNVPAPKNNGAHHALYDAIAQTQHLQALWKAGIGK